MQGRKQVRLRLRRDLVITPQQSGGRTCYVVKDPVSLRYWRFAEPETFLLQRLDGRHTLDEVRRQFEAHFRPRRLSEAEVEAFAHQLVRGGLADGNGGGTGRRLLRRW